MWRVTVNLLLASTSTYRAELLKRLGLAFEQSAPNCDETPLADEPAAELSRRLAKTKALSLQKQFSQNLIIGSDQVCELNGHVLGKPGTVENAVAQLRSMSGKSVTFHTGLCVLHAGSGEHQDAIDQTVVTLRELSDSAIARYVAAEMPLNCAGSFMVEKLGISLFKRIDSSDPTALIGLPMISLCNSLRHFGVELP